MNLATPPANGAPAGWLTDARIAVVRRVAVWAVFALLLYLLRDFLLIVFLTFVFAYAAEHALRALMPRLPRVPRGVLTVAIFLGSMGALAGLGTIIVPRVQAEVVRVKRDVPRYRDAIVGLVDDLKLRFPSLGAMLDAEQSLYRFRELPWELVKSPSDLHRWDPQAAAVIHTDADLERMKRIEWSSIQSLDDLEAHDPAARRLVERTTWLGKLRHFELGDLTQEGTTAELATVAAAVLSFVASILVGVATAFLALFFAFLIVIDLPHLKREMAGLESSRIGWLYREVRSSVVEFFGALGFILEAQAAIAVINTVLTVAGLWILGVPAVFLLGVLVFFAGFVPVLGTFISSAPILLLSLASGGVSLMIKSLVLIVVVHLFEAYVLEPRIFGKRFHLNAVFVILILFVAHSIAGLWGVILGLPVAYSLMRPAGGTVLQP